MMSVGENEHILYGLIIISAQGDISRHSDKFSKINQTDLNK